MTDRDDNEALELRQLLREQAERLSLALQAANLGTWEHVPSSHATYWDARSKQLFGLGPDEDLDFDSYVAMVHPDDLQGVFAGINKAMAPDGPGECSLQYRITSKTARGGWCWVEAHGRCTFLDGVPQRINGTLLDITERKNAEEAIREAALRKDEFLALLGHELRNPLAPIRTALDLMQARYPELAVREREVIDRQLKHMLRLVDDLLDLARVTQGALLLKREAQDLATAVQRAIEIASPLFEAKRHRLDVTVPGDLHVSIDSVRFSQIISNLLTNAAKFTPGGGHVAIQARRAGERVVIEIADDGTGIEPDQLQRIFEPFVQEQAGAPALGGLGLGLSLVRHLVELHGGSIEAQSAGRGRGSRFVVSMPLSDEPVALAATAPNASSPPPPGRRVLLVDDNEDALEMMSMVLTDRGHVVRSASDGVEALALLETFRPEVAVLDLGLPLMDGYELAGRLLEALGPDQIRLVALTGYGQVDDRARTKATGFDIHLVKPIDFAELEAALL